MRRVLISAALTFWLPMLLLGQEQVPSVQTSAPSVTMSSPINVFVGNFPNGMPGKLEVVDPVVGELETEDTVPTAESDRRDISKAIPQELQAEVAH